MELPKTEEELQSLIQQEVEKATKSAKEEYDGKFASQRKSYEEKIKRLEDDAKLSAEEKAQKLALEKEQALTEELTSLRSFKKNAELKERLAKENLPTYLANDSRLINAEDGELDKVIKVVKADYEGSLPKGNTHSTVVQTTTNTPSSKDDKGTNAFAEILQNL